MGEILKAAADWVMKLISSVGIADIIDITVVALVIYYAVKLVRQTRAFQLVKGVVYMGIIYFVVSAFNMSASSFLFSQLFRNIVIVMILLFQPEIRHAMESVGRGGFKKFGSIFVRNGDYTGEEYKVSASNISKAAVNMSDKKIGALIVIEGKTLLGEIISTGSAVDSNITSPMIENIFFPKAPLHDGAVIIRGGRVCAAGCFLPLATNTDIDKDLGTRHRAAIGLSQTSDAIVIVVSEETGVISMAIDGELTRNYNYTSLKQKLTSLLAATNAYDHHKKHGRKSKKGKNKEE
jgi:diadenylate cyclase